MDELKWPDKEKGDPVRDRLGKHRGCARRRQARKTDNY
jgi:hypothetical protein